MALETSPTRTTPRAESTTGVRTVPGGDPTGGEPRVIGTETPRDGQPVDARESTTRPRLATNANPRAALPQPTARGATTQPETAAGTAPQGAVDASSAAGATDETPDAPAPGQPGWLAKAGDTLENIGEHLESDKARLATTGVTLLAASTIPIVGNIIAIARGAMHLLGFLGSVIKGKPDFTQLFQGGIEVGLGLLFPAPMAAAAGMLIGEMGVPYLMGSGKPAERAPLNFGNRPPASAGATPRS